MRRKSIDWLAAGLVLCLAASITASSQRNAERPAGDPGSVKLIGVIPVPGNPLMSSDVAWVDPGTKRFYLAERSNLGIDVIDAENDLFVGRIPGFAGPATLNPPPPNGVGPNGVLVTPEKKLWAGDGNSSLRVADVDPDSPNYLKIIQSVSTAIPYCGNRCNRVDEIGYDSEDHIILAVNHDDQPADAAATTPPARGNPFVSFVSADTYKVLGTIVFEGAGGLEQPLWSPELHRFFVSVEGYRKGGGINPGFGEIAVINPKTMKAEKSYNPGKCRPGGEVMGPAGHLIILCGTPVILDAMTGNSIAATSSLSGGDEVWYNPGDGRFYYTGLDKSATPPLTSVVVGDAETGAWLQNVADPGARQAVAFAGNNHIFTPVQVTSAVVSDPASDKTTCSQFGYRGTGCIAVFAHVKP